MAENPILVEFGWLKTHLALLIIVIVLAFGGVYFVESIIAKHDANNDQKWQSMLAASNAQTQNLTNKMNQDEQIWNQQNQQNIQIIKGLASMISARDAATKVQLQADTTLTADDAKNRLNILTDAQAGEVTAGNDTVTMDLPITRKVIANLDELPTVKADLSDTQKQLEAETNTAANLQNDLNDKSALIAQLNTNSDLKDKACDAKISDIKAQNRKRTFKWSTLMLGIGIALARVLGI